MDRNEFKSNYDEIKRLMAKGRRDEALELVDSINWRKVANVNSLVQVSEVYIELGQFDDAKELLYIAHERSPVGRMILYHLALICVRMNEFEEAESFYSKFVEIAPHDSLKYVLKYQINRAKGVDDATLIAILEELKAHDFLEEWAYELAYLYHRTSQIDKCVDLCDELILWYGDGPYVERALEMKMIYQPLNEGQQDKYRQFQNRREGLTEIQANEFFESGEIVPSTIVIPQVTFSAEKFNTINLQAEIKRNIDEIMNATEADVVNENVEMIKSLVEEIPYIQMKPSQETMALEQEVLEKVDASIMDNFQDYLAEEYDGQMSLLLPDDAPVEEQIEGQMTIEDVIAEWEKTKRAAEAALQDAQKQKLESAKSIAIMEATQIIDQLEAMSIEMDHVLEEEEAPAEAASNTFNIPRLAPEGSVAGVGLAIPVVHLPVENVLGGAIKAEAPIITKSTSLGDTQSWTPPSLDKASEKATEEVDYLEASKIFEGINRSLQDEIDRMLEDEMLFVAAKEEVEEEPELEVEQEKELEPETELEPVPELAPELEPEEDLELEELEPEPELELAPEPELEEEPEEDLLPTEDIVPPIQEETSVEDMLPVIQDPSFTEDEIVEMAGMAVLDKINDEVPFMKKLTDTQRKAFSYFVPVPGMEDQICQAITGIIQRRRTRSNSATGNLIIQGGVGSGKTMLSTNIVNVLQKDFNFEFSAVGKIDGEQLNEKDMDRIISRVNGGCLIIEEAGQLSDERLTELCLFMEQDTTDILLVLEDEKSKIMERFQTNPRFASMFTEKIDIPIFSMDELVNFAEIYAKEAGYSLDEMAVLALHTRINLIQKTEGGTSLLEVRDIMEDAMDNAERGGIRSFFSRLSGNRYDDEGNLILREQDFEQ